MSQLSEDVLTTTVPLSICTQRVLPQPCVWEPSLPSDKSLTHRALLFAAWAQGCSAIEDPLLAQDCLDTLKLIQSLGCIVNTGIKNELTTWQIQSPGMDHWPTTRPLTVWAGNSGTTARLAIALMSTRPGLQVVVDGDDSLRQRPMGRLVEPLRQLGAQIGYLGKESRLPVRILGQNLNTSTALRRIEIPYASAQLKSAMLMAMCRRSAASELRVQGHSRDHSEIWMRSHGAPLRSHVDSKGESFVIDGTWQPGPFDCRIPKDPSSAALWTPLLVMIPSLQMKLRGVLENPRRGAFLEVVAESGALVNRSLSAVSTSTLPLMEPAADLSLECSAAPKPLLVTAERVPLLIDEIPVLSLWAALCPGKSVFEGLAELRFKESDRLAACERLLKALGRSAEVKGDRLEVEGSTQPFEAFSFDSQGDHRMAMVALIASLYAKGSCKVRGISCIHTSYPGFVEQWRELAIKVSKWFDENPRRPHSPS